MVSKRRIFGTQKYAALSILFARWFRFSEQLETLEYITLGGTELADVLILKWINGLLISKVVSYEFQHERFLLAQQAGDEAVKQGIDISLVEGNIFDYQRTTESPHIYFVDLEGTCSIKKVDDFQKWFEGDVLLPGDLLLKTFCIIN